MSPRTAHPFGRIEHCVETAVGDTQLLSVLDRLANDGWIILAPIPITHVDNSDIGDTLIVFWKIPAWKLHEPKKGNYEQTAETR